MWVPVAGYVDCSIWCVPFMFTFHILGLVMCKEMPCMVVAQHCVALVLFCVGKHMANNL